MISLLGSSYLTPPPAIRKRRAIGFDGQIVFFQQLCAEKLWHFAPSAGNHPAASGPRGVEISPRIVPLDRATVHDKQVDIDHYPPYIR